MAINLIQVNHFEQQCQENGKFSIRTAICFSSSYTSHPTRLHLCCHHPFLVPIISHPGASAASGWAPALAFDLSDPFSVLWPDSAFLQHSPGHVPYAQQVPLSENGCSHSPVPGPLGQF